MSAGPAGRPPGEARHPLGWVPVFVVGFASAVAAEVGMGLLLYSGPGFTRSLTTVLTVEATALAVGLWTPYPKPEPVDGIRRRWIFTLVAFLAATVFGTVWTMVPTIGSGRVGQGLGLAVLVGLPLYACGALLSGLVFEAYRNAGAVPPRHASVGAFGAAAGFALTGFLLPQAPTPASLLVLCLVLVSLGGMTYGVVRSGTPRRREVAKGCVGPPPVRVEERVHAGGDVIEWLLLEGDVVRTVQRAERGGDGRSVGDGTWASGSEIAWDVATAREILASSDAPEAPRVLHVGGGASHAPSEVLARHERAEVTVLERAHCVVELGLSHFGTVPEWEQVEEQAEEGEGFDRSRRRVLTGNLADRLSELEGPFDLVLVDGRAFDAVGGLEAVSKAAQRRLGELLAPEGVMVWGPKAAHHPRGFGPPDWETERRDRSETRDEVLVARRAPPPTEAAGRPLGGSRQPS
ncbi:MAG: hypothetical protein U5R14_01530 [Gemmatimonadota bacterium]|nr:hypothetical protein [Gemmatimonadota bacterium]